jgi:hypothetical protein
MPPDLTDDERTALIGLLVIENDPFPQSPRIQQLRGIVTKLRMGLASVNALGGPADPEPIEPADVDEAEALRFGVDFRSDDQRRVLRHDRGSPAGERPPDE